MSIELTKEEITIGDKLITIIEADWDFTFRFSLLDKQMAEREKETPSEDKTFAFFCLNYYPLMASCVLGDPPTAEEAYALPRGELDKWYLALWRLNVDIVKSPAPAALEKEKVTFRDGSEIVVYANHGLPSFSLKLHEYETYAQDHIIEGDAQGQIFSLMFYPKLAASCNGSSPPPVDDVRKWPRSEIMKWMEVTQRLNPEWFATPEEQKKTGDEKRKKVKKS